jgi:DNA-binding CsgD family transcriptional regulator
VYQKILASYYATEHYGKLTPTYRQRSHEEKKEAHIGMTGHASLAGAGHFRVHRLRDGWIDFAAFRKTLHYRLYFEEPGIIDRITIGYPVTADAESFFMIDRHRQADGSRRPFTAREAGLAGDAVRGVPELHRRLFLSHGLLMGDKPFSPTERQILHLLLTGRTEKEIAVVMGQTRATVHKYVTKLFARFGVNSRAALMARWLGDS